LLCAQHPYDKFRADALKSDVMDEIAGQIDLVEVFNARNPLLGSSRRAKKFAQDHHLPGTAGSDAHSAHEIGNAYVEMPEFKDKDDFLQALSQGTVIGHRANPFSHFSSVWSRIKKAG
jgi:predicted metal-dependent phosphoesterase TrpH